MKLSTDEEIVENSKKYIVEGFLEREIIRIREVMEEYPAGTKLFPYLYIASSGLAYALDPTQYASPLATALLFGKKAIDQHSLDRDLNLEDCSGENDQDK